MLLVLSYKQDGDYLISQIDEATVDAVIKVFETTCNPNWFIYSKTKNLKPYKSYPVYDYDDIAYNLQMSKSKEVDDDVLDGIEPIGHVSIHECSWINISSATINE